MVKVSSNSVSEASESEAALDSSFESCTNSYDFCVHFIHKQDEAVDSQFVNAEDNLSLEECLTILQDKLKRAMTNVSFKKNLEGEDLPMTTRLSDLIQCADDDVYLFYGTFSAIQRESNLSSSRSRKRFNTTRLTSTPTSTRKSSSSTL